MKTATIHQTKTHLSRLLKEVQAGETVVILNGSTPVARLTALDRPVTRRPRVGTRTSPPVRYANDAFRPLGASCRSRACKSLPARYLHTAVTRRRHAGCRDKLVGRVAAKVQVDRGPGYLEVERSHAQAGRHTLDFGLGKIDVEPAELR